MKKAILALMMAIVMVFTAMTVYAYGSNEEGINGKINPCPHTMTYIRYTSYTISRNCGIHGYGCVITDFHTVETLTCMECGEPLEELDDYISHTTHSMSSK